MRCRAIPYEGKEPFLFLSYSHADKKTVYPIFEQMAAAGYRVWYDEGNNAGDDWADNIARHLTASAAVVAFITETASESVSCNNELFFAVSHSKKVIPILMGSFVLSGGMELVLGRIHYLKRLDFSTDKALIEKVGHTDGIDTCLDKSGASLLRDIQDDEDDSKKGKVVTDDSQKNLKEILNRKKYIDENGGEEGEPPIPDNEDNGETEKKEEIIIKPDETPENTDDKKSEENTDEWFDPDDNPTVYTPPSKKKDRDDIDNEKTQKARNVDQILLLLPFSGSSLITSELEVIIGRSKVKSHFVIEDHDTIGRAHASILHSDKKYFLKDLNSLNGTFYQDEEVKDGKVVELHTSDIFKVHKEPVIFVSNKIVVQAIATGRIAIVMSKRKTGVQALAAGSIPLNRHHKWPDGTMTDQRVHRHRHARLEMHYDGCYLVEEGPEEIELNNGTFLNERRLDPKEACKLKNGDIIRLGDTELEFMLFEIKGAQ